MTLLVVAGFAGSVTLGLLLLGPWGINLVFEPDWDYAAGTLALVGVGMGLHLAAGTLNQSALAHGRAPLAAAVWALAAASTWSGWSRGRSRSPWRVRPPATPSPPGCCSSACWPSSAARCAPEDGAAGGP